MLKNFKDLFIKSEEENPEEEVKKTPSQPQNYSFPAYNNNSGPASSPTQQAPEPAAQNINDPVITEVLKVYESGLDAINMPGYDFYEFFQSVNTAGDSSEQAYVMAYKMAQIFDKTVTTEKLKHDAEFYISKISEVYNQYVSQGKAKLHAINERKNAEKSKLTAEIDQASTRIAQLRAEIQHLEAEINNKRTTVGKMDESYHPQEKSIQDRLAANDYAYKTSMGKLNTVKDGITRYIK